MVRGVISAIWPYGPPAVVLRNTRWPVAYVSAVAVQSSAIVAPQDDRRPVAGAMMPDPKELASLLVELLKLAAAVGRATKRQSMAAGTIATRILMTVR